MAQNNYQNLAPLIKTNSLALFEYFAATVAQGSLSVQDVSDALEGEGINWSNQKIGRVMNAVHSLYHIYKPEKKDEFREELLLRCITTKNSEALLDTLLTSFDTLRARAEVNKIMKLQQLISFDITFKHELMTEQCKNLGVTRAVLLFKIALPDGQIDLRRIEVSLEELAQIRKELVRIEEALN